MTNQELEQRITEAAKKIYAARYVDCGLPPHRLTGRTDLMKTSAGEFIEIDCAVSYYHDAYWPTSRHTKNEMLELLTPVLVKLKTVKKPVKLHLLLTDDGIEQIRHYGDLSIDLNEKQARELDQMIYGKIAEAGFTWGEDFTEPKRFISFVWNCGVYEPPYSGWRLSSPAPHDLFDDVLAVEQLALV